MTGLWHRYEAWLERHMPDAYWDLAGPATSDLIADSQELMGVTLPPELVESYRVHNGQRGQANGIVGNWRWLPLAEVVREWQLWTDMQRMGAFVEWTPRPDLGIKADWWNPRWVPFTADGQGNHHCLDFDPDTAGGGRAGQVIVVYSDNDVRQVLAPAFNRWLEMIVVNLEAERYALEDTEEGAVFKLAGLIDR